MIPVPARAVAAQTPARLLLKVLLSTMMVAAAALVGKEGLALSLLVIFSGISAPALRLVTLRTSGVFDRIVVSPVHKPSAVFYYAGIWSAVTGLTLIPAIAIVLYLLDPFLFVPIVIGIILAVTLGALSGIAAKTLGDAHLYAIIASIPLVLTTLVPGSLTLIPYTSLSENAVSLGSTLGELGFLILWLTLLAGVVNRM